MKEGIFYVLGFDIGGTKIAICLGTSDGKIIASTRVGNKDKDPNVVLPNLVKKGNELLSDNNLTTKDIKAIGIAAPAPHDVKKGIILNPANMPLWRNVKIKEYLENNFNIPVFFENDANAGALAEWFFGAGDNVQNMIYLTMSTGIGGGIICNGELVQGTSFDAGEIGHTVIDIDGPECQCGLKGCYEAFCGGRALALRLQNELKNEPENAIVKAAGSVDKIDMIALEKAVRDKDEYALKVWDNMILRNAQAIGGLVNIFNPDVIVLGTLPWATGDLFMKPFMEYLPRFCWEKSIEKVKITVSVLGRSIGEYAGVCVALNGLLASKNKKGEL